MPRLVWLQQCYQYLAPCAWNTDFNATTFKELKWDCCGSHVLFLCYPENHRFLIGLALHDLYAFVKLYLSSDRKLQLNDSERSIDRIS